jgi:hypothetical protein
MNDVTPNYSDILNHPALIALVVIVALAILLLINRNRLLRSWREYRANACLARLGYDQLTQVPCPDGLDHEFMIDRLILHHDGISILNHKKYPGKIFCAEQIQEWTQMIGQKSYKFKNPLFELNYQTKALQACLPDISVDGYLFFDLDTDFPKGHPDRVLTPDHILPVLERTPSKQPNEAVLAAWEVMKQRKTAQ